MRIAFLRIKNFRGIKEAELLLPENVVFVGDGNVGKSTIFEAIDLVMGPERLFRKPVVDEHDFYAGQYHGKTGDGIEIKIEVVVIDLSEEQERRFVNHLEWWDYSSSALIENPTAEDTNKEHVVPALRVGFSGSYDYEEDDFTGSTFFLYPKRDDDNVNFFTTADKRVCGFLYLRTMRTGARALSLERGSLLDIILRLKEKRPQMWEDVLKELRKLPVAESEELGISKILSTVQEAVRSFVPIDCGDKPHIRVSDLTREHLRKSLTVFMGTGAKTDDGFEYSAPFQHQGTGTINTLVLALLSLIAAEKQNVIFAMEEPEISIPPHTQKRIINSIRDKSSQALFSSHSPYVLEEFHPSKIIVLKREDGVLSGVSAEYPSLIKPKAYKDTLRKRCEALLARRVLITEGKTEYSAFYAAARRLNELHPEQFSSLEALGIAVIDAETETQIAPIGEYFKKLNKVVFAIFDKQSLEEKAKIVHSVPHPFESSEKGFENLIVNGSKESALKRFAKQIVDEGSWPTHLVQEKPNDQTSLENLRIGLAKYFKHKKGDGAAAEFLFQCSKDEMPTFVLDTLEAIQKVIIGEKKRQ